MMQCNTGHEVLVVVTQVRPTPGSTAPALHVMLWQHSLGPAAGRWALPGGEVRDDEDLPASATRQLAEKVDVRSLSHLESVAEFSDP
ncbi:NUDIX hydrolase, partial [Dietzia sp. SLG510A3-40A3]|nr:NUDIX hydrolase [Dietzia sp. SLG510A3-40A3]